MVIVTPSALLHTNLLRWVFAGVRALGGDAEELVRETGWKAGADPDAEVACHAATALVEGAIRVTNDPAFGLHTAKAAALATMGPGLACCGAARTSAALLQHVGRYLRLHGAPMQLEVEAAEGLTLVTLAFSPPSLDRSARAASEFVLGSVVVAMRQQEGPADRVQAVHFRHAAPTFRGDYDELFGCPVKFGAASYRLELERQRDGARGKGRPELPAYVADQSRRAMDRLPLAGPVSAKVRQYLAGSFPWGIPTMTQTAGGVEESVQGLYERLLPEKTSFAGLREELLYALASGYLRDGLSAAETAHLLGFLELGVFEQSFARWSGKSVGEFRAASTAT